MSVDLKHKKQIISNEKKISNAQNNFNYPADQNSKKHELKEINAHINYINPSRNDKNKKHKEKIGIFPDKKKIELIKTFSPDKIPSFVYHFYI